MEKITERSVDELGRIVLPAEVRSRLNIAEKEKLGVYVDGDRIILAKTIPACKLCGSTEKYNSELMLCDSCIERIKQS